MPRLRSRWVRDLCLYRTGPPTGLDFLPRPGPPVQTRFRSTSDPECFALYSMRDGEGPRHATEPSWLAMVNHTLVTVREFRRVPLEASALALLLLRAHASAAARVIAALAHWVEGAVSGYQPAYLLLAHSLEQPGTCVVLAAVHERRALQRARTSALSLHSVLPEVQPWLDAVPARYVYYPEPATHPAPPPAPGRMLSPFAI
ncbi:MAG: hypothetical protein ACREK6_06715 [Candidatus Rokuibacteriota bacterium]